MTYYKILLLTPSFDEVGGVSSFCRALVENITSKFEMDYLQIGNQPGNESLMKRAYFFLKNAVKLRKKLRKNGYHLIHLNPSMEIFSLIRDSFYLWIIHRLKYKNNLVMFHGWNESLAERIISNSVFRYLFQRIYRHAKLILVLCDQFEEQLQRIGADPGKVKVITTMYQQTGFQDCKHENLQKDRINVLFMSRLVKSKGVYVAAQVAKLLFDNEHRDFHFTFAGNGPEYTGLRDFIKGNNLNECVETVGFVRGREKYEIMKKCDILLFPTESEGCPVVVLEAMAAGLSILSTPKGAIPEIIKHGENGFIVNSTNPKDFYNEIRRLIDDRVLLKRMQISNIKKAKENYEAKIVTGKFESIYASIINRA